MLNFTLSTPLTLLISLAALTGIVVHDTKLSKLATTFSGIPAMIMNAEGHHNGLNNEGHTHVERVSLSEVRTAAPGLAPRISDQKKHMLQKSVPKGGHTFDGYVVPLA